MSNDHEVPGHDFLEAPTGAQAVDAAVASLANQSWEVDLAITPVTPTVTSGTVVSWSATGLPPGISINALTGELTGTPTAISVYSATFTIYNVAGIPSQFTATLSVTEQIPEFVEEFDFTVWGVASPTTTNLIHRWKMDDDQGGSAVPDEVGTQDATTAGTYTLNSSRALTGSSFDGNGTTGYMQVGGTIFDFNNQSFTCVATVWYESAVANFLLMGNKADTTILPGNAGWEFRVDSGARVTLGVSNGTNYSWAQSKQGQRDGTALQFYTGTDHWYTLVASYNASNGAIRIFHGDSFALTVRYSADELFSGSTESAGLNATSGTYGSIGATLSGSPGSPTFLCPHPIDEFMVFDRVLTFDEACYLYFEGRARREPF